MAEGELKRTQLHGQVRRKNKCVEMTSYSLMSLCLVEPNIPQTTQIITVSSMISFFHKIFSICNFIIDYRFFPCSWTHILSLGINTGINFFQLTKVLAKQNVACIMWSERSTVLASLNGSRSSLVGGVAGTCFPSRYSIFSEGLKKAVMGRAQRTIA